MEERNTCYEKIRKVPLELYRSRSHITDHRKIPYPAVLRVRYVYPDPDLYPSRIPDSTTVPKEEEEKHLCPTIFCSHKYHKTVNNFIFEQVEKISCQNPKIYSTFSPKKMSLSYQKYGVGIRDPESRVKKAPGPGSATLVPGIHLDS
jgi:hypothetical protein